MIRDVVFMTGLNTSLSTFLEYSLQVLANLKHSDYLWSTYVSLLPRLVSSPLPLIVSPTVTILLSMRYWFELILRLFQKPC